MIISRSIHVGANVIISFFIMAEMWCIHICVCVYHIFLIHSSVDGHLVCFHVLAVVLLIRWPKYWSISFSISPSNKYSGLIFFRLDWLDLLAVQGTLKSSPTPQFKSINSSMLSFLCSPTLTSIHDYWRNHSFG